MNQGKVFEAKFKESVPDDVFYLRLKDSPSSFMRQGGGAVRFTYENPYDSLIFYKGSLYCLELKSTQSTSLSIQMDKSEKGKNIKINQIEGLTEASSYEEAYSGFILDFRKTGNTYFLSIKDFNHFLSNTAKKSINENDVVENNGILVDKKLKRVHYDYNIAKMLEDIISNEKERGDLNVRKNK